MNRIIQFDATQEPTPSQWQRWFGHKSNKEATIEAEEREAENEEEDDDHTDRGLPFTPALA